MIKILIVDDHSIVRQGMKQIITQVPGMAVAGEAATGQEALDLIRDGAYNIVVLDISLPGRDGLEVLKDIKRERQELPVLMLSMHSEEQYALRALRDGASGYITKGSAAEELVEAIRTIALGRKYITANIAEKLTQQLDTGYRKAVHEKLSDREYQIMCMIAAGKTVKEIAVELCLSAKTVSTYRARVLDKMNIKINAEIIHYALKQGLVD